MENRNKIIFLNLLSSVVLQGLTFFSAPLISSALGTENYGIVSVYNTWVSIFSTVLPLQAASTIAVARSNFPLNEQEKYQSSVLSLSMLIYFIAASIIIGIFYIFSAVFQHNSIGGLTFSMLPFALMQGMGTYCVNAINSKFTYEFEALKNLVLSVLVSAVNILLSLFLIYSFSADNNYWGRILGEFLCYIMFGFFSYMYIYKRGKCIFELRYWKFTLPIAVPTVFHLLANVILGQSDRIMIQAMISDSAVGIYTLAASFSTVIQAIWSAFNNSWAPFYYEYTRCNQFNKIRKHGKNYIEIFTIITCGFILLSNEVYHWYASTAYISGTNFIPLFAVGYYFVFLYSFAVNFEFYHKKTQLVAIATMIAAAANLGLNYIGIKFIGILGAVVATVMAYFLQFIIHFAFSKKIIKEYFPFNIKAMFPGVISVMVCCVMFYTMENQWQIRWGTAALLGLYGIYRVVKRRAIF